MEELYASLQPDAIHKATDHEDERRLCREHMAFWDARAEDVIHGRADCLPRLTSTPVVVICKPELLLPTDACELMHSAGLCLKITKAELLRTLKMAADWESDGDGDILVRSMSRDLVQSWIRDLHREHDRHDARLERVRDVVNAIREAAVAESHPFFACVRAATGPLPEYDPEYLKTCSTDVTVLTVFTGGMALRSLNKTIQISRSNRVAVFFCNSYHMGFVVGSSTVKDVVRWWKYTVADPDADDRDHGDCVVCFQAVSIDDGKNSHDNATTKGSDRRARICPRCMCRTCGSCAQAILRVGSKEGGFRCPSCRKMLDIALDWRGNLVLDNSGDEEEDGNEMYRWDLDIFNDSDEDFDDDFDDAY